MDLSTATTDELLDELRSRHDTLIFIGVPQVKKYHERVLCFKGEAISVFGLMSLAEKDLYILSTGDADDRSEDNL
jgi:hypothetical protein